MNMWPDYLEWRNRKKLRQIFFSITPLPIHVWSMIAWETYSSLIRIFTVFTPLRYRKKKKLFVNIGAGVTEKNGWVNIDIFRFPGINCLYNCKKKLPFSNDSVRVIHCEHFLEHLDYSEEVPVFISECFRVLEKDGVLRISVPDAEKYIEAYLESGWGALTKIRPLIGEKRDKHIDIEYRTKMELINMVFRTGIHHKYSYDFDTLKFVLTRYGFSQVYKQAFNTTNVNEGCVDNPLRASESLYVEAVK